MKRRVWSPTKMGDLKKRMLSPIGDRVCNLSSRITRDSSSSPDSLKQINSFTTNWTREQSIIHEKVKMRVFEAKMSRFAGLKSPRVLLSKLLDNRINNDSNDYDVIESSEVADVVTETSKWNNTWGFKLRTSNMHKLSL